MSLRCVLCVACCKSMTFCDFVYRYKLAFFSHSILFAWKDQVAVSLKGRDSHENNCSHYERFYSNEHQKQTAVTSKELEIRHALGASNSRIRNQSFTRLPIGSYTNELSEKLEIKRALGSYMNELSEKLKIKRTQVQAIVRVFRRGLVNPGRFFCIT